MNNILHLQAQLRETALTSSRPLNQHEFMYVLARRSSGSSDPSTIVSLVSSGGHTITDEQVVLACAVLRLRHPLFASHVSFVDAAQFVVTSPLTYEHALRQAKAQIEFHAFHDQDQATLALRDEWHSPDPAKALDIRERTCCLWWGKDADQQSGRYVFGLQTTHFVTDNRHRLSLVRSFLELLADPGQAKAELTAHFSGESTAARIPASTEQLKPDLSACGEDELAKAKTVFDELVTKYNSKPMSGIVPNGTPGEGAPVPRIVRHIWSAGETARILSACKAQAVTVTHLANVAIALASIDKRSVDAASGGDDSYYFDFGQAIDLTGRLTRDASYAGGDTETAERIEVYPVVLRVPRSMVEGCDSAADVWGLARQFKQHSDDFVKSPYFWHLLRMYLPLLFQKYRARRPGNPCLPYMSSLGDLKSFLPTRYVVKDAEATGDGGVRPADITITDKWTAGRVEPQALVLHLFTFDGRLHLQFRYNAAHTTDTLIQPWWACVIDIISGAAEGRAVLQTV